MSTLQGNAKALVCNLNSGVHRQQGGFINSWAFELTRVILGVVTQIS